ncbi:MAG: amino acid carrier protein [Lachnospiraceae bacterium]|nr:amino acid carrier protein [Lachnospiraceae bacterium]
MNTLSNILAAVDGFVWGPVMLVLLVGTGIFLTCRLRFRTWRNLGYALKSTLSKEARTTKRGEGDVSPFAALTTALAATIGTGNIVGVATAMVSGGPGALVWMEISAAFGLTSKFAECMMAIKYREVNEQGEMTGGPMYTMKKGFKNKKVGAVLGFMFALFAVIASFGIGNLTQANSISSALDNVFHVPTWVTGVIITVLALAIIVGGIKSISKVSSVVVPLMAIFYVVCGLIVIVFNITNVPAGVVMIFKMAFSVKAVGGGMCGALVASMMNAMRYGVARGCFSNEAGLGSAAITAAAATTDDCVRQGYINMTGTFWDTIVVCTITGLCIASSGVLGATTPVQTGTYVVADNAVTIEAQGEDSKSETTDYTVAIDGAKVTLSNADSEPIVLTAATEEGKRDEDAVVSELTGTFVDGTGNAYVFGKDGSYTYKEVVVGSALTILAFESVLGKVGGWLVCIGITLFAFSTILGWEYHGEKAVEYLFNSPKYNMLYRIIFSLIVFVGATTALDIVWNFSDIANALMAIPNLICLLVMSKEIANEVERFQGVLKEERKAAK